MLLQRVFICITGVFFAVGFAAPQASAGPPPDCSLSIEINALRGGSPTVSVNGTKAITAKARISKGTADSGTTIDVTLRIDAVDGEQIINTQTSGSIRLGVGKGGHGDKLVMSIPSCNAGVIEFVATFFGPDSGGDLCEATRSITKTCK